MNDDIGSGQAVIDWARGALPAAYATVLEDLTRDAERDLNVTALLLTGSMARRDALPGTDIDVRIMIGSPASSAFNRRRRACILIEQTVTTEALSRATLLANPMHVYAYLDGVALYDPDGTLARLRATAEQVSRDYSVPVAQKRALAEALAHPEEKTRTGLAAGDLLKATYSLATVSWQLIEGLWAANDLPLPPNASVRPHLRDLRGPDDVEHVFAELFLGEPTSRVEAGLQLLGWTRRELMAAG